MSGNGTRRRKTHKATTQKKNLGRAALRSIVKNEETVEQFLSMLDRGSEPPQFDLARVERALGGGRFEVRVRGKAPVQASLAGLFAGRGEFWKNPEVSTAVRVGQYVIVEDLGLGYGSRGSFQIVGIPDAEQTARAMRLLKIARSSSASSNGGFTFERSSANAEIAAQRAQMVGEASAALASLRRQTTARATRRSSSGRLVSSGATTVSSEPNWAALSEGKKAAARAAKLTRRKERKRAKKAAAAGGTAWAWFKF
jgi:hypothetical protein